MTLFDELLAHSKAEQPDTAGAMEEMFDLHLDALDGTIPAEAAAALIRWRATGTHPHGYARKHPVLSDVG